MDLDLMRRLRAAGVALWLDGDTVRYRVARGALPPALRAELKARKDDIREFLRQASGSVHDARKGPPITPAPRDGALPLSFSEQRLWFLDRLESQTADDRGPGNATYNVPAALRLRGRLDVAALERVFAEVVRRHEVLRTTFGSEDGRATRVIHAVSPRPLTVVDLSALGDTEQADAVRRRTSEEASLPFDLEQGPLLRTSLLRLSAEEYVLLVTMHHIVSDGWSMGVLVNEVAALYTAFAQGEPSPLDELRVQYADFAAWQQQWMSGDVLETELAHWRERLSGARPLELATDRPRPAIQTYRGASHDVTVSAELTARLNRIGREQGATSFMTLLAAFQVLLARYSGTPDVSVGTPVANRNRTEVEPLIGFFVNTLVMRSDISGNPSFVELVTQVRDNALGAYAHQDVPFEKLVDALGIERDPSRTPMFQVMFVLQNTPMQAASLPGLELAPMAAPADVAKFDLTLSLTDVDGALHGGLEYNCDLFDAETIARMVENFGVLLRAIAEAPERPIGELALLTPTERRTLLEAWNDTRANRSREASVHAAFTAVAARTPDAVAAVFGDAQLTYAELNQRANQLAHHLRALGVGPDVLVGVSVARSLELVVALLGILKAGGAYVPLDPDYPPERLRVMLDEVPIGALVSDGSPIPWSGEARVDLRADEAAVARRPTTEPEAAVTAAHLAYVMYTSGSTGRPKGVCIPHGAVVRLAHATNYVRIEPSDVLLQFAPVSFDASTFEIWGALLNGARVAVAPPGVLALEELGAALARHGVTVLWLTAPLFHRMVDDAVQGLRGVRALLAGGDALSPDHVRRAQRALPGCQLINGYGPTENTTFTCCWNIDVAHLCAASVPIGRPIDDTRVYLLDANAEPVPVGAVGELYAGGAGLARGYLGRPELTADRFVPDPCGADAGARLYRVGDRARYLADGRIAFLGRVDHQVKVRGFRIELAEIESALREHATVRACVVDARQEGASGERTSLPSGDKRLVAYVVVEEGAEFSAGALREHALAQLPGYMVPAAFVQLDALPLSANGKIDRKALALRAGDASPATQTSYEAPRTDAESTLAEIWAKVLRLPRVGIRDNFFEAGGDSILSIQVVSRANRAGLRLSPKLLFQHPTIAELAALAGAGGEVRDEGPVTGEAPLTPIQRWFFEQRLPSPHHFNQSMMLEVSPSFEAYLEPALRAVAEHHDAFRLRYVLEADAPQQRHADAGLAAVTFARVDLRHMATAEQDGAIEARAAEEQVKIDLEHGPLLRTVWFELGAGTAGRLLIVAHHLVIDGVSWRIVLEDLNEAVMQAAAGAEIRLPPKTTSFKRWSERLAAHARTDAAREELAYWSQLPWRDVPRLPRRDGATGENRYASEDTVRVALTELETEALLKRVPQAYHTQINDVLLTALGQALAEWTGADAVLIDLEGHGREELWDDVDLSRTVGWFTALYPVLLQVPRSAGAGDALKSIKEQLRAIPNHGIGYGLLRFGPSDEASPACAARAGGRALPLPAPEVSFNYFGQVDQSVDASSVFRPAPLGRGPEHDPRGQRAHLLDVTGIVAGDRLHLDWIFSSAVHAREAVQALADRFSSCLRALIAHCLLPDAGGYTPSDFPLAKLDQAALDQLVGSRRAAEVEDLYRLSPLQQGMLFHMLREPESGVYVVQLRCVLDGALDAAAFERAWQCTLDAHASLRASFHWEGLTEPAQVVHRKVILPFAFEDLRALSEAASLARVDAYIAADRQRSFDPTLSPLLRVWLARTDASAHQLVVTFHHLLLDGWSLPLVFQDVFETYEALVRARGVHEAAPAREPPRPYRDYVAWLGRRDRSKAESFWKAHMRGVSATPALGLERPTANRGPSEAEAHLSMETTAALQALAREHHLTLNTLLQGAWAILLSRYTGETDIVFGTTVSGRPPELDGVESMVGLFINTLPMRTQVPWEHDLLPWLLKLQELQVEMRQYEYTPLVEVQAYANLQRGEALFDTLVVFENYPIGEAGASEGTLRIRDVRGLEQTNYGLTATVSPAERLELKILYDAARFESNAVRVLLRHWCTLLEGMATEPERRLGSLPLLTQAERRTALEEWNATATDYPRDASIQDLFEAQAARTPDAVAVSFGERQLTYAELERRANQLAHHLRNEGVRAESLVGLSLARSPELVIGLLGILKAGGAYVPLDPDYPVERLRTMLEEAPIAALVTDAHVRTKIPWCGAVVDLVGDAAQIVRASERAPAAGIRGSNLAYVMFTSGSTGRPKGVSIPHRGVVRLALARNYVQIDSQDVLLQFAPVSFDASTFEIWSALLQGARVALAHAGSLSLDELGATVERHGVTVLWLTAPLFHQMADSGLDRLRGVRALLAGGDALSPEHVRRAQKALPGCRIINGYGPTENTTFTCCWPVEVERIGASVPIGRPIDNTRVYLLDANLGPVPVGAVGEVYAGGDGLGRGYVHRPELTAERFVADPHGEDPGARLYRVGDRARYLADGRIEFLGRVDNQVKVRGFRIELGEIEAVLREHATVRSSVVAVRGDAGDKRVVAYVVSEDGAAFSAGALREHVGAKLPAYMVPAAFVQLDALPLSPNGKVDRKALPAPDPMETAAAYEAPRTDIEQLVAGIVADVLGLSRVGVNVDFFAVGGHSLSATQVIARLRTQLRVELPLRAIFEASTVAGLAAQVEAARRAGAGLAEQPLRPVSREGELPLSFAQQRLWFLDQLEPGGASYNVPSALRLRGELDVDALARVFGEVVRRHEALRTTFATEEGAATQVIHPAALVWDLPEWDLTHLPDAERASAAHQRARDEAGRPFDLTTGPLLRTALLRLGPAEHVLLVTMHHIVSDGWSVGVLVKEVAALYAAFITSAPSPLVELPIQYADFAAWQRQWLSGAVLESQLDYWRGRLANASTLELPTDRARPLVQTYRGGAVPVNLTASLTASLHRLSREQGATLFMTLLAAFQVLLSRYSGQADICVGTPVANRNRAEVEPLIGFFVNTLVMRSHVAGDARFVDTLRGVREAALGAYAHQDVPFERVVEALGVSRDLSRTPLFQVMFVLQNAPMQALSMAALELEPIELDTGIAKFDMSLALTEEDGELQGDLEYNLDLFDRETVERMAANFAVLLQSIVAAPERRVDALALMTDMERQTLASSWNDTDVDHPGRACVHELFESQAARAPDGVAVVFGELQLTYGELNRRANRLAHQLRALGVGPDVPVCICAERSLEMVVGLFGILKAGGAYVPLDPSHPAERLAFIIGDVGAPVVLAQAHLLERLPAVIAQVVGLDPPFAAESNACDESSKSENLTSGVSASHLAYVIYTSGSTGAPKGAMNTHGGFRNRLVWMQDAYGLTPGDTVLQKTPYTFDVSVWEFFWPLMVGARLVVARPDGHRDSAYLAEQIAAHGVTTVHFVPSMLELFVEEVALAQCTSLRRVICSGEALPYDLTQRFFARCGAELHNLYGPTEASIDVTYWACPRDGGRPIVPIGRPIANTQMHVVDAGGDLAPQGAIGELCIAGVGLARGYLNQPGLTAERFVPDPFGARGGRSYRTGDRARWLADGALEFLGRGDHQVKIHGHRIELGEIETALLELEPVRASVVVAWQSDGELGRSPQSSKRLVAYVVAKSEAGKAALSVTALREHLAAKLPGYMVPSAFVQLDALPLSANGKVDRKALPSPHATRIEVDTAYEAPRTARESQLADIWSKVLRLPRVGVHDNFFEVGGDSILSIQVVSRANKAGLRLSPKLLFQHPTIAELATVAGAAAGPMPDEGPVEGDAPLTPIQRWFFERHAPALPSPQHFNQSLMFEVALEPSLVERALHAVAEHHDALRLRYARHDNDVRQHHAEPGPLVELERVDLRDVPEASRGDALEVHAARVQASLDLSAGPLLRAVWFEFGTGLPGRLLLVLHHLVIDGVSWRILLEDLQQAVTQLVAGERVQLPAKTTSFKRWSDRLRAHAQSAFLEKELPYWEGRPWNQVRRLPRDRDGENSLASRATAHAALTARETDALLKRVPQAYHTQINDVLLTALSQALAEWTGGGAVLVDLEGHGREELGSDGDRVDLSRTVGWFTSLFPVVLETGRRGEPGEMLKSIKEQLRQIPNHGIGYGLLRYSRNAATLANLPVAEVCFNYLGQMDGALADSPLFRFASEGRGPEQDPRGGRAHLVEVNGMVADGRLHFDWIYSANVHEPATVESLAERFVERLRALIAHCLLPGVGGYTPSDFPLASLDQVSLDRLVGRGRDVEDVYRLSPMQQGMLFHTLHDSDSGVYFEQMRCVIEGELDAAAFEQAWQLAVQRHAVLRTSFHWEGLEAPVQVVHARVVLPFAHEDLRALSEMERRAWLRAYLVRDRAHGFVLASAPLIRVLLARLGDAEYELVVSSHHVLMDGWSLPLLFADVFALYEAPSVEVRRAAIRPYRDYIAWLGRQDADAANAFWRDRLRGFSEPTSLRLGRPLAPREERALESKMHEVEVHVSLETTRALNALARARRLTLNTLLQGAWAILLSRHSGESDVVFGATVSGRPADIDGAESMVGLFINTLPVRVHVDPERTLVPWLEEIQMRQAEMQQYEYSPLVDVQASSDVPRGQALFDTLLVVENYPIDETVGQTSDIRIRDVQGLEQTNYGMTVNVAPGPELMLKLGYDAARFETGAVSALAHHWCRLLHEMVAKPEQRIGELSLLTEAERRKVVAEWNATSAKGSTEESFPELFEAQAARTPDALAVVCGDEQLTYLQLNDRATALAQRLHTAGALAETVVALSMDRGVAFLIGMLAAWKAGCAYLPLDPEHPAERLAEIVERSGARWIVTSRSRQSAFSQAQARGALPVRVEVLAMEDLQGLQARAAKDVERPRSGAGQMAYVIYTSGSTGTPKGAMVEHRGMLNHLDAKVADLRLTPGDVVAQTASQCFDISVWQYLSALMVGGRVHVFPDDVAHDPRRLFEEVAASGVTILEVVPSLLRAALDDMATRGEGAPPLRTLRWLLVTGETLPPDLCRKWLAVYPEIPLMNAYGPTECSDDVSHHPIGIPLGAEVVHTPIGRPIQNTQLYVLDSSHHPAPIGVRGELYVGGVGVGRGYLNDAPRTAESFVPDPFTEHGTTRLYKTGDVARWLESGELEFLGRVDHQVKVRGFRIELGEIEAALEQHEAVRDVVVMARQDGTDKRLVAYVVGEDDAELSAERLREHLHAKLPGYMVPSAFVALPALPLTPNGKVDRKALPAPDAEHTRSQARYEAPRTVAEQHLAAVWQRVLRTPRVGIHDDFFELGGDSILAIQVVSRAQQVGIRLTPKLLFEHPTIAELAAARIEGPRAVAEQGPVSGGAPLTPIQRHFFALQMPAPHHYNQSLMFEAPAALDPAVLARALESVAQHHDALRLRFAHDAGAVFQQHHAESGPITSVECIDLSALSEHEQGAAIEAHAGQAQAGIDLGRGPLFRAVWFALGSDRPGRLLVIAHHLVIDGVSWRIVLDDLEQVYTQLQSGRAPRLPPKTTSFKQWSERLAEHARSTELARERDYWTALPWGDARPLPRDGSQGEVTVATVQTVNFALTAAETEALLQRVPQHHRTQIQDVLLTALSQTLAEWTGGRAALVNLEGHGREELFDGVDLSRTVGWFTSLFPVVLHVDPASGPGEALAAVQEQLHRIPNRGVGFGLLRHLGHDETASQLAALPIAEVGFNYLGQTDGAVAELSVFRPAPESRGPEQDPRGRPEHALEILGAVAGGCLHLDWTFSPANHAPATMEAQGARFMERLRALIAYGSSLPSRHERGRSNAPSPLLPFRTHGSQSPFFCVHALGGSGLVYRDLANRLGDDIPFYSLHATAIDTDERPGESVEAIARHYVEAIRTVDPKGPYRLGGWSFGALVAFEMAQQLVAEGQEVAVLCLIDETTPSFTPEHKTARKIKDPSEVFFMFEHDLPVPAAELVALTPHERVARVVEEVTKSGLLSAAAADLHVRRLLRVAAAHLAVEDAYVPRPYPGRISLVRVPNPELDRTYDDPTLGWREVAPGRVDVELISGDHLQLVHEPQVAELAERLRRILSGDSQ